MTVEEASDGEGSAGYKIYKGVNQVFAGSEEAARSFLGTYEKDRPGLFEGSIYGYQE